MSAASKPNSATPGRAGDEGPRAAPATATPAAEAYARLLADIRDWAPEITARAAEIEAGRRIPPDLVEVLKSIGAFRLFIPRSGSGLEFDLLAGRHQRSRRRCVLSLGGGGAVHESSPLQRRLRDLRAAVQHATAQPRTYFGTGKLLLDSALIGA